MKKIALLLLLAALPLSAQQIPQPSQDFGTTGTSGTVLTLAKGFGVGTLTLSAGTTGTTTGLSVVVQGCMRVTNSCTTLATSALATPVQVTDGYDYITVTPTWTGSGTVTVYITGIQAKLGTGGGSSVGSQGQLQMAGASAGSFAASSLTDNGTTVSGTRTIALTGSGTNFGFSATEPDEPGNTASLGLVIGSYPASFFLTDSTNSFVGPQTAGFYAGGTGGYLIFPGAKKALRCLPASCYAFGDGDAGTFGVGTSSPVALFSVGSASQFQVDGNGGVKGLASAPSGTCTNNGAWVFSQDGHATFCASGTWTTKI